MADDELFGFGVSVAAQETRTERHEILEVLVSLLSADLQRRGRLRLGIEILGARLRLLGLLGRLGLYGCGVSERFYCRGRRR